MKTSYSIADLEAYLDEALPAEQMAKIEEALRRDPGLVKCLAGINARRDHGLHSLGEIWRRARLTCLNREQLGNMLMGIMPQEEKAYAEFHLRIIGCRLCQSGLNDLHNQKSEAGETITLRRRKFFQSSAGYLKTR